jgi:hypothetical protein
VRNGDTVFTWRAGQPLLDRYMLTIPGQALRADQLLPNMSDLGLYILPAGEKVDMSAFEQQTKVEQQTWTHRLQAGVESVVRDPSSPLVQAGLTAQFECFQNRIKYVSLTLKSIASGAEDPELVSLDTWFNASGSAEIVKAFNGATGVDAASTDHVDVNRAPAQMDDVVLAKGNVVLLRHQRTSREDGLYRFDAAGKPLVRAELPEPPGEAIFAVVSVKGGTKNANRTFAVNVDSGTGLASFSPALPPGECKAPAKLREAQRAEIKDLLVRFEKKLIDRVTLDQELQDLARKVGLRSREDLQATLKAAREQIEQFAAEKMKDAVDQDEVLRERWMAFQQVESIVAVIRDQSDSLPVLVTIIKKTAIAVATDPESQERIYRASAKGIGDERALFKDRVPNPQPIRQEVVLPMQYRDVFQNYYLAAWTGIPLPVFSDSGIKYEPRVENLIPIIDFAGWRVQWGDSVFTDFRWAAGIIGTRETRVVNDVESLTNFNLGPQFNITLAGAAKLGVAYIVREDESTGTDWADRRNFRVLLGADIVKLITGKDTAASVDKEIESND